MAKYVLILALIALSVNGCFLCEPKLKESGGIKAFLKGVFMGFQLNPNYPSPCLRKFEDVDTNLKAAINSFLEIFNHGDLSFYFDSISELSNMMDDLDDAVSICQVDLLTNQLNKLFTPTEASAMAVRISAHSDTLISYWTQFAANFGVDNLASGEYFGKFLSIIFDYKI
ncbi:hypothetical protein SteCoe_26502 [Stentor coeruleus]|uniref:Pectinesterase inhibitor domain-containing protein n=1 Tax=Stentor coeruleus TaxID=5963 RepID=A0A1R2BCN6_9CILI|nr:hypothetical protein SteCoe_26502 [Stentor coeruleus]